MKWREGLDGFWPLFISTHLHPWNRRFHAAGNAFMFSCLAGFAITGQWWLIAMSLLGYVPSWIGHFLFEGNVPVTFKNPFLSALSDLKMIGLMISGELEPELVRLFGSKHPRPGTPIRVSEADERAYQQGLRFRIRADIPVHPFKHYWDIFVLKHQSPINIGVHVFAMIYLYGVLASAFFTRDWRWLMAIPLSPLMGLVSHALFERTHIDFEDAIFSPRAFGCLNRLLLLTLTGRYPSELRRTRTELAHYLSISASTR